MPTLIIIAILTSKWYTVQANKYSKIQQFRHDIKILVEIDLNFFITFVLIEEDLRFH